MDIRVAVILGSDSDFDIVKDALDELDRFSVGYEVKICSAHRTPVQAADLARTAKERGIKVIIAAAGKAAHLPGVIASHTTLPVIGLPIRSSFMDGLDSLLSIVQMPSGVPVAAVSVNGSRNAALLALEILALSDEGLSEKMSRHKADMEAAVLRKNRELEAKLKGTGQEQL